MDLANAELALRRAETDLMSKVRGGYFAVLVAEENIRIAKALLEFTTEIYKIQVTMLRKGGTAAGYEPGQLEVLALQAHDALFTARNRYVSAWKQLAATLGLPGLPLTQLAGGLDRRVPVYDHAAVLKRVLANHTDVRTAENGILKAKYNLQLAQVTPIPDVDVRVLIQKDNAGGPGSVNQSINVSIPFPIWDRNQGGIIQAQGNLIGANEEPDRVRNALTMTLADAYERYKTNYLRLRLYRDRILPTQVRAYRALYSRYVALGGIDPTAPAFGDVVTAQQTLAGLVTTYVSTLGSFWQAVVDVNDLLQTNDLFQAGADQPDDAAVPDLDQLPPLPCCHPCAPLADPRLKVGHGDWPSPVAEPGAKPMPPPIDESLPVGPPEPGPPVEPKDARSQAPASLAPVPSDPGVIATGVPEGVDPRLLEPPPPLKK
jgi:cobalt-zinc-cadmium efflux system outer membrane protein